MKYLEQYLSYIKKQINSAGGYILISDFDGTLSPIVKTSAEAYLPKDVKESIKKCFKFFPVAIVSGRLLSDIKQKVGIKGLIYAGSHGLEWQIEKRIYPGKILKKEKRLLATAKQKFTQILSKYPGALLEDKKLTLAINYRMLAKQKVKKFKKEIKNIVEPLIGNDLIFVDDKKTFELRPKAGWVKGDFVNFLLKYLWAKQKNQFLPIYIGDAKTDESVFKKFKNIITIKVGKNRKSAAKYYIRNQKQINRFLMWLSKVNIIACDN